MLDVPYDPCRVVLCENVYRVFGWKTAADYVYSNQNMQYAFSGLVKSANCITEVTRCQVLNTKPPGKYYIRMLGKLLYRLCLRRLYVYELLILIKFEHYMCNFLYIILSRV
jgi:hypothetical protein